jgi:flagellar L-ring protein precursor FlgH
MPLGGNLKMKMNILFSVALLLSGALTSSASDSKKKNPPKEPPPSPLDVYVRDAAKQAQQQPPTEGSLWTPVAQFADLGRDLIASRVNDLVTIVVTEQASAVSTGASQTSRQSSLAVSVPQLLGVKSPTGALANLVNMTGANALNGNGTTSRQTTISTTVSARVTHVLPNGYLVLEGTKSVQINSESQVIVVRGIVRPADLAHDNSVPSDRLAQMEIQLNGKGVVGDAIRRPNALYRFLMGILPF